MKLHYSPTSPYVRKVMVVAHEKGLVDQIETAANSPWDENDLSKDNPIRKIPALVTDDGMVLFDSRVICEYLDDLGNGEALFPTGGERWSVLRKAAMGEGILDAGVSISIENRRDKEHWSDWHVGRQKEKINQTLDALESEAAGLDGPVDIGRITVGCALGYITFRGFVGDWTEGRPALTAWYEGFKERPSMKATEHKE